MVTLKLASNVDVNIVERILCTTARLWIDEKAFKGGHDDL
jgi:hypothetical protein